MLNIVTGAEEIAGHLIRGLVWVVGHSYPHWQLTGHFTEDLLDIKPDLD
jgi:hypothetical protein